MKREFDRQRRDVDHRGAGSVRTTSGGADASQEDKKVFGVGAPRRQGAAGRPKAKPRAMVSPASNDAIKAEIDGLSALGIADLRVRWSKVVGRPAPLAFRRAFLARALAHEIQVKAYGGLPATLMRRLRELVVAAREDRFDEALGASTIKPGTLLIRVWKGTTHRVMAANDGFIWNGERYGSLSTIAQAITGVKWNGWVFFGVKRRTQRNKNARLKKDARVGEQRPPASSSTDPLGAARSALPPRPSDRPTARAPTDA